MLKSKNMFSRDATGSSSPEWKTSVKAYQEGNGLTKTGSLNRATLEKMGIELTDKQKTIPVNPAHLASSADEAKPAKSKEKSTAKAEAKSPYGPKRPAPFRASVDQNKAAQKVLRDGKMLTGGERPFTGEQASITGTTAEKVRWEQVNLCLLYTSPSPRDRTRSRMPSSA